MELADDLLKGARAIAEFTGFEVREIYEFWQAKALPIFKVGKRLCARRSELLKRMSGTGGE